MKSTASAEGVPPAAPLPQALRLLVECPVATPMPVVGAALAAAAGSGMGAWSLGGPGGPQGSGADALTHALAGELNGLDHFLSVQVTREGVLLPVVAARHAQRLVLRCQWDRPGADGARAQADARDWLAQAQALLAALLPTLPAELAEIAREPDGSASFIPSPPLARLRHAWMTDAAEVEDVYGPAAAAFLAAWEERRDLAGSWLLTRAHAAVSEPDWAAAVADHQLRLAKAAPAGETDWHRAVPAEWNARWLNAAHQHLHFVGRDDQEALVEFAASVGDGGLSLGELQSLHELRSQAQDGRGRPVRAVRVVYPSVQEAAVDAGVLADLGIDCRAYAAEGELVAVPRQAA
ncbi:hypothetical protein WG902_09655 [Ramlibacter sp. PS3R-8]|uniref:hypothetical protein n=1 Tax=Ramlibacter sp. PS3R-8 TaxID=3133437 RepID=UPI0030978901